MSRRWLWGEHIDTTEGRAENTERVEDSKCRMKPGKVSARNEVNWI